MRFVLKKNMKSLPPDVRHLIMTLLYRRYYRQVMEELRRSILSVPTDDWSRLEPMIVIRGPESCQIAAPRWVRWTSVVKEPFRPIGINMVSLRREMARNISTTRVLSWSDHLTDERYVQFFGPFG